MADGMSIDLDELNTLAADLAGAADRVGARAATVVRKVAKAVERDAKIFAPVDTGNLRGSIGIDYVGDGRSTSMEAQIGPTAAYGIHVELGTSRMAPHAFLGPALDRNGPLFEQAMRQVLDEIGL
jgi:HK97 gp10 family phage protein